MTAKAAGIGVSSVHGIRRAQGVQPHRVRQFKLSRDPGFVSKLRDVVGLYVEPPPYAAGPGVDDRHREFIRFPNAIEAETPAGKIVQVILDNHGSHQHPKVRARFDRHPRFIFHDPPTSASWPNAFEGFFAKLTTRRLKRAVLRSPVDRQAAIRRFLAETNDNPKPSVSTADPDKIISAVRRRYQTSASIK